MTSNHTLTISYGKARVPVYRVYARPLHGITPIPESQFIKRENVLFACEIDVEVFGTNFLPAYTHGDNSNVVATDSMKNFILRQALTFEGSTLEAFLALLGNGFLQTYPQMHQVTLNGRELPFHTIPVPQQDSFGESQVLFSRSHGAFATASLDFAYKDGQPVITNHRCGLVAMELFKVTGSSFSRFVRDEYTTLQERVDRPLFIALNVYWKYADGATLLHADMSRYVPAEQVRDLIQVVFHEFVSESIQHLVHEIGLRLLERFPQLDEVSFEARNLTRDLIAASPENEQIKVYSDPFPAYGLIKLNMGRNS
jgi:urate oxidase